MWGGKSPNRIRAQGTTLSLLHPHITKEVAVDKEKNPPVFKTSIGYVKVSVFKNGNFFNTELTKSYKDREGKWQDGTSLGTADLLNAAKCLERAEGWIADQLQYQQQ
jgi:hypothetical protein